MVVASKGLRESISRPMAQSPLLACAAVQGLGRSEDGSEIAVGLGDEDLRDLKSGDHGGILELAWRTATHNREHRTVPALGYVVVAELGLYDAPANALRRLA